MSGFDLVPPLPRPRGGSHLPAGLRTVRYLGGKAGICGGGRWIASGLSAVRHVATGYAEPFFGMGGVLLRFPRIRREVVNDADWRIATYWRTIRSYPEAFHAHLQARQEGFDKEMWEQCRRIIEEPDTDPVELAVAVFLLLNNSYPPNLTDMSFWLYGGVDVNGRKWGERLNLTLEHARNLSERMRSAHIHNEDGLAFMRAHTRQDDLIFCDPPYPNTESYVCSLDHDAFAQWCADNGEARLIAVVAYAGSYPALAAAGYEVRLLDVRSVMSHTGAGDGRFNAKRVLAIYLSPRILATGRV